MKAQINVIFRNGWYWVFLNRKLYGKGKSVSDKQILIDEALTGV